MGVVAIVVVLFLLLFLLFFSLFLLLFFSLFLLLFLLFFFGLKRFLFKFSFHEPIEQLKYDVIKHFQEMARLKISNTHLQLPPNNYN